MLSQKKQEEFLAAGEAPRSVGYSGLRSSSSASQKDRMFGSSLFFVERDSSLRK